MLGNLFLTFYRITTRHPLYAALDLLGLSFGVAVFVTLSLHVRFETSFERWLPHVNLATALAGMRAREVAVRASGAGLQPLAIRRAAGVPGARGAGDAAIHRGRRLFVLTWAFFAQISHLQAADLGFRRDGLLVTESTGDAGLGTAARRQVWAAMRQVPGVTPAGSAATWPGEEDGFSHVVLNARMVHALGFDGPDQAVGQRLDLYGKPVEVIGVVGNLRFRSPKTEQEGVYYYAATADTALHVMAVRFEGAAEPEMRARLTEAWRSVAPRIPLELKSADDSLDKYYAPDRVRSRLVAIAAAGAALIGCLGLYGMAAFGASRRMLELAIRKISGAKRKTVVRLLVARFLRPVLLSNLLAAPIAYWVLAQWLVQFEDRIAITPVPFLAAGATVLTIAVLTVAALSYTAASREPGRILRHE